MESKPTICPNCQIQLETDAPGGLCPECLLQAAVSDPGSSYRETLPRKGVFSAPDPETLSKAIDSIEVLELLGHGGMGAVYRARQVNLDRPVALKILAPRLSDDPGFEERFSREAKTLARLNHPNIVTVYDFGRAGKYCYLVMELIEGVNLRDAIVAGGISAEQSLRIVPAICEALQYAHDMGVVHRDIKPENILIGLKEQVKIADFGLAKLLDHAETDFTLTATQQILGTRNYMAPEQIEKPTSVDHRADIYSLGVVFYELLTGELPLGRFSLPSEKAVTVNGQMDNVVLRALEKEPGRRYQQASEVKSAVESIDLRKESPLQPINGAAPAPVRSAMGAATGKPEMVRQQRRHSLPFKNDGVLGGLSCMQGIAHLDEDAMQIEYRMFHLGVAKSARKTASIPYSDLAHTMISRGVFGYSLEIHGSSLDVFGGLPGTSHGSLTMKVEKSHDQLLDDFRIALDSRLEAEHDSEQTREVSFAQIPFKIGNINTGIDEATGIANVSNSKLLLDFEVSDLFGKKKLGSRKAQINLQDVIAVTYNPGWFWDTVQIQTNGIDIVAGIPGSGQGKFTMTTKKSNRLLTENWLRKVYHATGLTLPERLTLSKPNPTQQAANLLRQRLKQLRVALGISAMVNASVALVLMFFTLAKPSNFSPGFRRLLVWLENFAMHPTPAEWWLSAVIGPAVYCSVAIVLLWLLGKPRYYPIVIVGLFFLTLPWNVGVLAGLPVAIAGLVLLLNPENRQTFLGMEQQ